MSLVSPRPLAALLIAGFLEVARSDGVWEIVNGSCQIDPEEPECITSPNFPNNYTNNDGCEMRLVKPETRCVDATSFDVELCCDYITIGSKDYNGRASGTLQGQRFNETVFWKSDYSVNYPGWRLCARELSQCTSFWYSASAIAESASSSSEASSSETGMASHRPDVRPIDMLRAARLWLIVAVAVAASVLAKHLKDKTLIGPTGNKEMENKPDETALGNVIGHPVVPSAMGDVEAPVALGQVVRMETTTVRCEHCKADDIVTHPMGTFTFNCSSCKRLNEVHLPDPSETFSKEP